MPTTTTKKTAPPKDEVGVYINVKLPQSLHKRLRVYCVTHEVEDNGTKRELYLADVVTAALERYLPKT